MSFFGGNVENAPNRETFDTFYGSFLVVFQVLTMENSYPLELSILSTV